MKKWLLLLMTPFVLGACDDDDASRIETWTIAPEKGVAGIHMSFGYVPAYIVRKGANPTWEVVTGPIEGFTFEKGWQTTLRVRIDAIANPPADAPDERCTMEKQLSRTAAAMEIDPLTFSPELEIRIASRRADAQIAAYWIQDLRYDTPQWELFPWEIDGFNFKPGHEYRLRIQPVAVYDEAKSGQMDNDSWTVKYRMRELLSNEEKESEGLPE